MSTVPALSLPVPALGPSPKERLDEWFAASYAKLTRRARSIVRREGSPPTLDPVLLVHETYERLVGYDGEWCDSKHVFCTACRVMKHVLLDWIRRNQCAKRGGSSTPTSLHTLPIGRAPKLEAALSVRQALGTLEKKVGARAAAVVEYKMYGDLCDEEIAEVLNVSKRTVRRDWAKAQSVLRTALA